MLHRTLNRDKTPAQSLRGRSASLRAMGQTPDYRFSLANERTFLAWIRTALALIGAGVAVLQFIPGPSVPRDSLGLALLLLGGLVAGTSYRRWYACERAMRLGEELPVSLIPRLVAGVLVCVAGACIVAAALTLALG